MPAAGVMGPVGLVTVRSCSTTHPRAALARGSWPASRCRVRLPPDDDRRRPGPDRGHRSPMGPARRLPVIAWSLKDRRRRLRQGSRRLPACGRYWDRTSDLFGVNEARSRCANRPLPQQVSASSDVPWAPDGERARCASMARWLQDGCKQPVRREMMIVLLASRPEFDYSQLCNR